MSCCRRMLSSVLAHPQYDNELINRLLLTWPFLSPTHKWKGIIQRLSCLHYKELKQTCPPSKTIHPYFCLDQCIYVVLKTVSRIKIMQHMIATNLAGNIVWHPIFVHSPTIMTNRRYTVMLILLQCPAVYGQWSCYIEKSQYLVPLLNPNVIWNHSYYY